MAIADRNGLPVSVYVESATPHEVTLAMSTLLHLVVPDAPQNLVADFFGGALAVALSICEMAARRRNVRVHQQVVVRYRADDPSVNKLDRRVWQNM